MDQLISGVFILTCITFMVVSLYFINAITDIKDALHSISNALQEKNKEDQKEKKE